MILCPFCGTRLERNEHGGEVYCRACGYDVLSEPPLAVRAREADLGAEGRVKQAWHLAIALAFIGGAFWLVFGVAETPLTAGNVLVFVAAIIGYGVVGAVLGPREPVPSETVLNPLGCLLGHVVNGLILRLALYPGRAIAGAASGIVRLLTRRR